MDRIRPSRRTGRLGYHPSVLLKLYIYGYLNRVQSSRRLEQPAGLSGRSNPIHPSPRRSAPCLDPYLIFGRDEGRWIPSPPGEYQEPEKKGANQRPCHIDIGAAWTAFGPVTFISHQINSRDACFALATTWSPVRRCAHLGPHLRNHGDDLRFSDFCM